MRNHEALPTPDREPSRWPPDRCSPGPLSELPTARFVKLPTWFTASGARTVLKAKRLAYALIEDRGQIIGCAALTALEGAPGRDPVSHWMTSSTVVVSIDASADEALALMTMNSTNCLPVVAGPILVGMVTRADLEDARNGLPRTGAEYAA
jgi:hypothetical protein